MMSAKKIIGGLALTVASVTALAACSSSSSGGAAHTGSNNSLAGVVAGMYGSVPAASGTAHAGTITIGQPSGINPWILPIMIAADNSIYGVYNFDYLMFRPLYWYAQGVKITEDPAESLAALPVYTNGDKTVTITLNSNYKWSNGTPVTAQDIEFWYYVTQAGLKISPANWATYVPGEGIPDDVSSISAPNSSTVVFNLKTAVNPTWFTEDELSSIQPMPSTAWAKDSASGPTLDYTVPANATKIYKYLAAQSTSISTYASNPLWQVVDGPYKLSSYNTTSNDYTFAPNTSYGGPHATVMDSISIQSFASDAAEYNAIKAGALDFGYIPTSDVPQAKTNSATYSLFGYAGYGWQGAFYNFKDKTGDFGAIVSQLYFRQALQHLVDQQGIIDAYLHGAGGGDYGTVGQYPPTAYTPADDLTNLYPYSVSDAASLLKDNGWTVVPNGTTTCTNPGTGAGQCGAGIPKGTPLNISLQYASVVQLSQQESTLLASVAKQVGINFTLKAGTFAVLTQDDNDVATPADDSKWAIDNFGGFTDSTYPTTFGLFNSTGSSDMGGYNDTTANSLINDSVNATNPAAVGAEMSYLAKDLPVLYFPNPDWAGEGGLIAINKAVSGPPASFEEYAEYWLAPELWYLKS